MTPRSGLALALINSSRVKVYGDCIESAEVHLAEELRILLRDRAKYDMPQI